MTSASGTTYASSSIMPCLAWLGGDRQRSNEEDGLGRIIPVHAQRSFRPGNTNTNEP